MSIYRRYGTSDRPYKWSKSSLMNQWVYWSYLQVTQRLHQRPSLHGWPFTETIPFKLTIRLTRSCTSWWFLLSHGCYFLYRFREVLVNLVTFKIFLNLCSCVHLHAVVCMWRLEDSLWELALSFYRMGSKDWTQIVRLGGKHPYLLLTLVSWHFWVLWAVFLPPRGNVSIWRKGLYNNRRPCLNKLVNEERI